MEDGGASSIQDSKMLAGVFQQIITDCKVSMELGLDGTLSCLASVAPATSHCGMFVRERTLSSVHSTLSVGGDCPAIKTNTDHVCTNAYYQRQLDKLTYIS